jgi:SAM-dependent methyltransferase
MRNVPQALAQWWRLVKPGGYLILVVPDENLYEQGTWPSLFNYDHKATFRIGGTSSWSPVSYDIRELVASLPGAELLECELQDAGYDHSRRRNGIGPTARMAFSLRRRSVSALRRFTPGKKLAGIATALFDWIGAPTDQTDGLALAQIQVIAQKRN